MRFLLNGRAAIQHTSPLQLLLVTVCFLGAVAAVTLTLAVRSFRRTVR